MRWLGFFILLAACGQDANWFHAPDPGNLAKDPYDFSAESYPRDLSAAVFILTDMTVIEMSANPDIRKPDLNNPDNVDMAHQ